MGLLDLVKTISKKGYLLEWQNTLLVEPVDKLIMTEKQLTEQTRMRCENDLRIIHDSVKLVGNTVKPDVFFSRLQIIEESTADMVLFEKYMDFKGAKPSEALAEVQREKQKVIADFLMRYLSSTIEKARSMKTDKGKLNKYSAFYESLVPYFEVMNEDNVYYVESRYNAYSGSVSEKK